MKTGDGQSKYCIPQPFSRCLISLCSCLFDFNSIFIFSDLSRSCSIQRWAKLIVQGFCSGFSSLGSQFFMYISLGWYPYLTSFSVTSRCILGLSGNRNSSANDMFYSNNVYYRWITRSIDHETERELQVYVAGNPRRGRFTTETPHAAARTATRNLARANTKKTSAYIDRTLNAGVNKYGNNAKRRWNNRLN